MTTASPKIDWIHQPFAHQAARLELTKETPSWATLWEQGTGKTALTIMEAAHLYVRNEITGVFVLAPAGIHFNWVNTELPIHWPLPKRALTAVAVRTQSLATKYHQAQITEACGVKGLAVMAMSYDALDTDLGRAAAKQFLTSRRCMIVADESGRIKTPTARRTILACKAAQFAPYRRILNGTPVPNGPFDIYSQICFLDPIVGPRGKVQGKFWLSKGINSFEGFRTQFGEWGRGFRWIICPKSGEKKQIEYPELIAYKNLDILYGWLRDISDRVTKDDVLDLPPKMYKTMQFDMGQAQRRIYNELRDEAVAFLDNGDSVSAPMALTRLLRLQQVTCGYVPTDKGEPHADICGGKIGDKKSDNPRLALLKQIVADIPHKAIIWARFKRDIDQICQFMRLENLTHVRYDGEIAAEDRERNKAQFCLGAAQFFVANPAAAAEGLTLLGDQTVDAKSVRTVVYYSNSFSLQHRLQSEDRCHRIGQRGSVQYIDLVARDSVDERIISSLIDKNDISKKITGDKLKDWLTVTA